MTRSTKTPRKVLAVAAAMGLTLVVASPASAGTVWTARTTSSHQVSTATWYSGLCTVEGRLQWSSWASTSANCSGLRQVRAQFYDLHGPLWTGWYTSYSTAQTATIPGTFTGDHKQTY